MELTGPSLAARLAEEDEWIFEQLGGSDRGWGPGSNEGLGKRRQTIELAQRLGSAKTL